MPLSPFFPGSASDHQFRTAGRLGNSFVGSGGGGGGGGSHPRILTSGQVSFLQTQQTNTTSRWTNVKAIADSQVAKGATVSSGDINYATSCALVYAVTGTQSYADRVDVVLKYFCVVDPLLVTPPLLSRDRGYDYANVYWNTIRCLDWAYNGLTTQGRQQAATWLMDFADYIWPATNNASSGNLNNVAYGANEPGSNYFWRYMYSGPAALASWDDDIGTTITSPGSTDPRPAFHLNYMKVTRWEGIVAPFFARPQAVSTGQGGLGGGFAEGPGYGTHTSWEAARAMTAVLNAGEVFDTTAASPITWAEEALRYSMHVTAPRQAYRVGFGDSGNSPTVTGGSGSYFREAILTLMDITADATLKAQALYFVGRIGNIPTVDNTLGGVLDELLYFDPAATAATDLSALPLYYLAAGAGHFMYRNSWTDDDTTFWAFDGGAVSGHSGQNSGEFHMWKGAEFVSSSANRFGSSGIRKETYYYNNLILDNTSQNASGTTSPPMTVQTPTSTLVAIRQNSTSQYNNPVTRMSAYYRTVVYLPTKDTFIVLDDATTSSGTPVKTVLWQMKNLPNTPGSTTFKLSNPAGDFHGYGEILATRGGSPTFSIGKTGLGTSSLAINAGTTSLAAGGTGYAVNDTGTVNGGNGAGTYIVDSVSGGVVTGYTITGTGANYGEKGFLPTNTTTGGAQPGSGTGFKLWVNTTSHYIRCDLPTGTAQQIVCTVIQMSSGASAPYAISAVDNTTNYAVTVDGLVVTIPLDITSDVTAV